MADIRKNGKQYGLVCPKKTSTLSAPTAINVFGNDQESEDEDGTDWVKKALKAEGEKNRVKKQTRLNLEKALKEDPTICQYDQVFDDMKRNEEDGKAKKEKRVKKAKYIDNLLKTAERRKREQEHRIERMVQKEREAEGAMYADKESFVTSAYRAKLEEFNKMEKDEENMDRLESIGDVTKQRDMSGFYRHLFRQTVAGGESPVPGPSETTNPKINGGGGDDDDTRKIVDNIDGDDSSGCTSSGQSSDHECQTKKSNISRKAPTNNKQARQYRRRVVDEGSEPDEPNLNEEDGQKATNEKNPIEEKIADDKESELDKKRIKQSNEDKRTRKDKDKTANEKSIVETRVSEKDDVLTVKQELTESTEKIERLEEQNKKNKVSIWEKRTVGTVFEAALQRYYTRKATRLSGS